MIMELDVLGLLGACSYALDCVEAELVHVTDNHSRRVAYMSVCTALELGITGNALQDLAALALLHDNALTQYIQEELNSDPTAGVPDAASLGIHCSQGEENLKSLPFFTDISHALLYHHETADGTGPFGKTWQEVPLFARIIHLCDILDVYCRQKDFTGNVWQKVCDFLSLSRGTLVDTECLDAFTHVFSETHFLSLTDSDLEDRLWQKVPRQKQELSFVQIRALADFFARIVDFKSPFTSRHSLGVAEDVRHLADYMGFDDLTQQKLYLAGALHDIGKVAVGNEILEKPGRLTDEEFAVMKHHASYTYHILSGIQDFDELRDWAAFHHEKLDGSGYPFRKTAAELNTQERMMACIDIYQALTEDRPYKKGMSHEKACEILQDMADRGFVDADITAKIRVCFAAAS